MIRRPSLFPRFALALLATVPLVRFVSGCHAPPDLGSQGQGGAGNGGASGQATTGGVAPTGGAGTSGTAADVAGTSNGGAGMAGIGGGAAAGTAGFAGAGAGSGGDGGASAGSAGLLGASPGGASGTAGMAGAAAGTGPACGGKYCAENEYCCNPSCGTCAPNGQGCIAGECDRMRCGRVLCPMAESCCSASCGECGTACGAITTCEPDCSAMDAHTSGMSPGLYGWFWDGSECVSHYARSCSGSDCENRFASREECEVAFQRCLDS